MPTSNSYDYVHEDGEQGEVIVGDLHYVTADYEDIGGIWKNTQVLRKNLAEHGRTSDFDIALADPTLLEKAAQEGTELRGGGLRTAPSSPANLKQLGLDKLVEQLSARAGRKVSFMIYKNAGVALQRAPGIMVWPGHTR